MRMFVAAVPPPEARAHLCRFLEARHDAPGVPRWVDPDQTHSTLAFVADVPERGVDRLTEGCAEVAARASRFEARLFGGGCFPNPYAARILWVGVDGPEARDRLTALARSVRHAASRAGAPPSAARFRPHVTVGRFPRPVEATRWVRLLEAYVGPQWTVEEICLVRSHLGEGRGGRPRHVVVDRFPLAPPGDPSLGSR